MPVRAVYAFMQWEWWYKILPKVWVWNYIIETENEIRISFLWWKMVSRILINIHRPMLTVTREQFYRKCLKKDIPKTVLTDISNSKLGTSNFIIFLSMNWLMCWFDKLICSESWYWMREVDLEKRCLRLPPWNCLCRNCFVPIQVLFIKFGKFHRSFICSHENSIEWIW